MLCNLVLKEPCPVCLSLLNEPSSHSLCPSWRTLSRSWEVLPWLMIINVIMTMPYSNKHRSVHQKIRVLPGLCVRSIQRNRPLYPYPCHPSMPDLARGAGENSTRKASPFSCKPEDLWLELNRREGLMKDTNILQVGQSSLGWGVVPSSWLGELPLASETWPAAKLPEPGPFLSPRNKAYFPQTPDGDLAWSLSLGGEGRPNPHGGRRNLRQLSPVCQHWILSLHWRAPLGPVSLASSVEMRERARWAQLHNQLETQKT